MQLTKNLRDRGRTGRDKYDVWALLVIISQTLLSWVLLLMITKDDIQIKIITQSSATAVCVKSIFWQNLFLGAAQ